MTNNLVYEQKHLALGKKYIAGIDEVGRGPLAGPVVTAAVIMPLDKESIIEGVTDSKLLSPKKREELSKKILDTAICYSINQIEHDEIDRINILEATKKCMALSAHGLKVRPDVLLIDGLGLNIDIEDEKIIKGDLKSYSISCASIIAKVYRDALMDEYAIKYPAYGFERNKGYGTREHIAAIEEVGACPIHRLTFIKKFLAKRENA